MSADTQNKPAVIKPEDLHRHLLNVLASESKKRGVPVERFVILIAQNLVPVFERMSDVYGLPVYSHPLMLENKVSVKLGRYDYGSKMLNDLWHFVRVL